MSSGNLPRTAHPELFRWNDGLDPADYVLALYRVDSDCDGEATALGMAMEQSAATTHVEGYVRPDMLRDWTIRVRAFEAAEPALRSEVRPYQLQTDVYAEGDALHHWRIELAIPRRLLANRPAQLLNVVVGELPRLGFLSRFQLERCDLPLGFGPGPAFGVTGLRDRFGVSAGPLLCRSMRPAVGLDTATMARLNEDVLSAGFHLVKDDELQLFASNDAFAEHVAAMVAARDRARDRSGENKGYLANLICEPDELEARWEIACAAGVDGVLVAPMIQGLGVLSTLARRAQLPLLAHNSFSDLGIRHPTWGIAHPVLAGWQRALGADWVVTSGQFGDGGASESLATQLPERPEGLRACMPIIQGGKHPGGLARYRAAVGSDDFMMIVASWVDSHPEGLPAGARIFREALV